MTEPLLQCTICTRRFAECQAHPAHHGRHKGRLVGPVGCNHPLQWAVYIDPRTGRMLVPYAPAELSAA